MSEYTPLANGHLYTDAATGVLKERRFKLTVKEGPEKGLTHVLEHGTLMVGLHDNNDLVLTDDTISRYHLEIQVRKTGLLIKDLGTTNGTFYGEAKVGTLEVSSAAQLRLGKHTRIELAPIDTNVAIGSYQGDGFGNAIGSSDVMKALFAMLSKVAPTDATVLLEGETGTGKEVISEAIHNQSNRARGPFIVVDCGAIPENLIGSELFGHRRGAFTGATTDKLGLIKAADGGTLFLDEIGELSLELQPQLLRVLEKREIRHIGDTMSQSVDIRVIAATNRNLLEMVREGTFREDLYYRLAVVRALLPPLRERGDDIALLAMRFADNFTSSYTLSPTLLEALKRHPWDGNVRELRNVVERALSLRGSDGPASATDILSPVSHARPNSRPPTAPAHAEMLDMPFKEAKGLLVEAFERDYLEQLLTKHRGNISQAANEAGIDRNYIHRLIKKYGLTIDRS
tara:strand:+ start:3769 stop:5139 length:1371 start_codon:yes stop_codon:yes gene_type:complete